MGQPKVKADYWQLIRDKADELGTDGCTFAGSAFRDCCKRHDIEYRTGQTVSGKVVTRDEADRRFLACMQSRSRLGWFSPIAWLRYLAVRQFGDKSWRGQ
jgi:hypothetical protein